LQTSTKINAFVRHNSAKKDMFNIKIADLEETKVLFEINL